MKRTKTLLITGALLLAMTAVAIPAFAANANRTPAEAAAEVTGKTVEAVQDERAEGKTYGQIADEAGKLDAFKTAVKEIKVARLQDKVSGGQITQAEADAAITRIEERQANCDGTGNGGQGQGACDGTGLGLGNGNGLCDGTGNGDGRGNGGQGQGQGRGNGGGRGQGGGRGLRDGSCL